MIKKTHFLCIIFFIFTTSLWAQFNIQGYAYEGGNRGFIAKAEVVFYKDSSDQAAAFAITDKNGKYELSVFEEGDYRISIIKDPFFDFTETVGISKDMGNPIFLKHEIDRKPGYIFDITLSELDPPPGATKDALKGALIEVYNNTTRKEELIINSLQTPDFQINLLKGNHYTILIRKEGFLTKRLEAFVDVKGCILCFEGIGTVEPGVSDNLSASNSMGVLLANVEIDRSYEGKTIGLNNIYYGFNLSNITKESAIELDKASQFLKDNPQLSVELGSHTDSRGTAASNLALSNKRAKNAVEYLVNKGGVARGKIRSMGYGESKLINDCADGVICPEEKHARNRRTELTILGIDKIDVFKSLRQMKMEENMDDILAELAATEQVKIAGQEIPAEADLSASGFSPAKDSLQMSEDNSPGQTVLNEIEKSKKNPKPAIKEPAIIINDKVAHDLPIAESADTVKLKEQKAARALKRFDELGNYSGFKIVLHFSRYPLPEAHHIFTREEEVIDYVTADRNHLYLTGDFSDKKEATVYMKKHLIEDYPQAYIVGFKEGTRIY